VLFVSVVESMKLLHLLYNSSMFILCQIGTEGADLLFSEGVRVAMEASVGANLPV